MLKAVSQLGLAMLLLLTGMVIDLGLVNRARRATLSISLTGILVPFTCGFLLGEVIGVGRRSATSAAYVELAARPEQGE